MKPEPLPVGKLPAELLRNVIKQIPIDDPDVLLGPGIGLDCAVVQIGDKLLVLKSDPITFVSERIGWYAVQINTNDIAIMGATPRWFLVTLLLPAGRTPEHLAGEIMNQVYDACQPMEISIIGGHTEITHGLERPILIGTMIGEVEEERLVTPANAQPGDHLLLSKHIPIEAVAIIAGEHGDRLKDTLSPEEITRAKNYLDDPGISVYQDAKIATNAGKVHAMHDPTEGGLSAALWELAEASKQSLWVDLSKVQVSPLWKTFNQSLAPATLDPMAAIASGALLMAVDPVDSAGICRALQSEGLPCTRIGGVERTHPDERKGEGYQVWSVRGSERSLLPRPDRDEITKLFKMKY